jgi:hypothetical protein
MVEGAVVAVVAERGHPAAWSINLDFKLLAAVYGVRIFFFFKRSFVP